MTVAAVLDLTIAREGPRGDPWCPPHDARALRRWIIDRPPELGGGLRRLARLVALAAVAEPRSCALFFYGDMPALRAAAFRRKVDAAKDALAAAGVVVGPTGVAFSATAEATSPPGGAFEISYAQMPRLAALLDFTHNALVYHVVADILAPALSRRTTTALDDVSRRLQSALSAWLTERLESAHHLRQSQTIRRFLAKRGAHRPDAIDDDSILGLWEAQATASDAGEPAVEGFRLFRSVVQAMLVYRGALADAAAERNLENPASADATPELLARAEADPGWDVEDRDQRISAALLNVISASRTSVKWLNEGEIRDLVGVLGGSLEGTGEADGLAGLSPVPPGFEKTILRVETFAPIQAKLIAAVRRKLDAASRLDAEIAALPADSYVRAAATFTSIAGHLRSALLVAAGTLLEAGRVEGVVLALELSPDGFAADLIGSDWQRRDTEPGSADVAAMVEHARDVFSSRGSNAAVVRFARQVSAARRDLKRQGFRSGDSGDPRVTETFASTSSAVREIATAVQLLADALSATAGRHGVETDAARFEATLRRLHAR